jgi:hypothetical protein
MIKDNGDLCGDSRLIDMSEEYDSFEKLYSDFDNHIFSVHEGGMGVKDFFIKTKSGGLIKRGNKILEKVEARNDMD